MTGNIASPQAKRTSFLRHYTRDIVETARRNAERQLVDAAHRVSTATVGNGEFSFEELEDTLYRDQQRVLERIAATVKAAFDVDSQAVDVVGFADRVAGNASLSKNQALAERRAEYVAGFFRRAGIPDDKLNIRARTVLNEQGAQGVGQRFRKASVGANRSTLNATTETSGRRGLGLSPAEMAIGASDFLMERAKAELETYVLRVGLNKVCTEDPSLYLLLRATCTLLPSRDDSLRYIPAPAALQDALRADLRELPYSAIEFALTDANSPAAPKTDDARERAVVAIGLVRYLRAVTGGVEPLPALSVFDTNALKVGSAQFTVPARLRQIATIARFSWSAREELASQVSQQALGDTAALYVLKALALYGRNPETAGLWTGWIGNDMAKVNRVLNGLRTAQRVAHDVEGDWEALRSVATDSAAASRRMEIVADLVSTATSLLSVDMGIGGVRPDSTLRSGILEPARDFVVALTGDDSRAAVSSLVRLIQLGVDSRTVSLPQQYNRLLGFANDAAQARTSAEFGSALENLVGPQGSYLSKRESRGAYARLNAFVGASGSYENITGKTGGGGGLAVGLAVPIGVEFGEPTKGRGSRGIFLQLLDLGAVASARLAGDDTIKSLPDFKLGSIVGPGIFFSRGLNDSPISVLAGVAYFPQGRETKDGSRVAVVRGSVALAIDIPLFP